MDVTVDLKVPAEEMKSVINDNFKQVFCRKCSYCNCDCKIWKILKKNFPKSKRYSMANHSVLLKYLHESYTFRNVLRTINKVLDYAGQFKYDHLKILW